MASYAAIPYSPELMQEDEEKVFRPRADSQWEKYIFFCACIATILSTILSFVVYFSRTQTPQSLAIGILKRPNPYPNLETVFQNGTHEPFQPFQPIQSLSQLLLQVYSADPARTFHEESSRQRYTSSGTVYPDDRHFIVSRNVTTVIQFKTLDFGMERCVLNAVLPKSTEELDPEINLRHPSVVDVWKLDLTSEITRHNPETWLTSPNRLSRFARFGFPHEGAWASEEFHCESLSFTTLEFACSPTSPDCHVEFWQDRASANGIYIEQRDSLVAVRPPS